MDNITAIQNKYIATEAPMLPNKTYVTGSIEMENTNDLKIRLRRQEFSAFGKLVYSIKQRCF